MTDLELEIIQAWESQLKGFTMDMAWILAAKLKQGVHSRIHDGDNTCIMINSP